LTGLGHAYAIAGRRDEAVGVLAQLKQFSKRGYVMPYWAASIHTALDDNDEALRLLKAAYEERSAWMAYLKVDSRFDSLRSDPRFQDLLRRMNFPP
jgi:hypothetical protein